MKKLRSRLSNGSEKLRRGQLVGDVVELSRAAVGRVGGRSSGLEELWLRGKAHVAGGRSHTTVSLSSHLEFLSSVEPS